MNFFHRTFKRDFWIDVVVDAAIERQNAFEAAHPITHDPAVHLEAVMQRAELICREHGASIIPRAKIAAAVKAKLERVS